MINHVAEGVASPPEHSNKASDRRDALIVGHYPRAVFTAWAFTGGSFPRADRVDKRR